MNRMYPRPQLVRQNWVNLNGQWDFDFDDQYLGVDQKWFKNHKFSKKINVPFTYQTKLSGINDVSIHERVWYNKDFFYLPKVKYNKVLLNFAAVDYEAHIYVNELLCGTHIGGSTSFSLDITSFLNEDGNQKLTVMVYDPSLDSFISRGKQTWRKEPFECFYNRTTGIWQTVWIEEVNHAGLEKIKITPNIDTKSVHFETTTYDESEKTIKLTATHKDKVMFTHEVKLNKRCQFSIDMDEVILWSPESPNLYDLKIEVIKDSIQIDVLTSYFGMRKISVVGNRTYLNNEPYYLRMILDQGYYEDGLLSYPSEEELLDDIRLAKQMGFNGARKHEKIEAERLMYYADKEGYLLSLEMPSQYSYKANSQFTKEWLDAVDRDYNHPSLIMLIPFNESWGVRNIKNSKEQQDYVTGFYYLTKSLDPTRLVVGNDGWEQTVTDICAIHTYRHGAINDDEAKKAYYDSLTNLDSILSAYHTHNNRPIYVGEYKYSGEPIVLSEFGGVSFANKDQKGWGYTGVENKEDYVAELERIFSVVYESKHIYGFCYTQLTDVEQEINGLLGYDRKPKVPLSVIKKIVTNTK